jgi:hypothetical protein
MNLPISERGLDEIRRQLEGLEIVGYITKCYKLFDKHELPPELSSEALMSQINPKHYDLSEALSLFELDLIPEKGAIISSWVFCFPDFIGVALPRSNNKAVFSKLKALSSSLAEKNSVKSTVALIDKVPQGEFEE